MPGLGTARTWSLLTLLLAYGVLALLPVLATGGYLLFRVAHAGRIELEERVRQIAEAVAGDLEREFQRRITVLQTLATSPRISQGDFAGFHVQARAAVGKDNLVILLHDAPSRQQLLNTLVEYGTPLPTTGDPETFDRVLSSKRVEISDLFVSLVSKTPAIDIALPVIRNGRVRYVLKLALSPDHFRQILAGQTLDPRWTLTVLDRRGVIVARSQDHSKLVGTMLPAEQLKEIEAPQKAYVSTNIDGQPIMVAHASIASARWHVRVNAPFEVAQAPLNRSTIWLTAAALLAVLLTMLLGAMFASMISRPLWATARMAHALGRHDTPVAPPASYKEADAVAAALLNAAAELDKLRAREQLVVSESSHRVKNILAVVQSLVQRTLSDGRPPVEARNVLIERLQALGRAHDLSMSGKWQGASLEELVAAELSPYGDRVKIQGPYVLVEAKMGQTLALLLHELATNAGKYGALSNDDGRVSVTWVIEGNGASARFTLRWQERGGPVVKPPTKKGFGSALLEGAVPTDSVTPRLSFDADGFVYEINVPLSAISAVAPNGTA
jgi:two-component sensor histidine kinase